MVDRLTAMLVFQKAADTGSFAAAADQLGMSAQMAGRHVARLEQRLGARLLNRSTHSQSLTEAGEAFLKGCRRVFAELDAVEEEVVGFTDVPRGTLRVTAPVGIGSLMIVPRIREFLDRHPEVRLELMLSDRTLNLIDDRVDAAVRVGDLPELDHARPIARVVLHSHLRVAGLPRSVRQPGATSRPRASPYGRLRVSEPFCTAAVVVSARGRDA